MKFHVYHQGENLGQYAWEELRRRREVGEFSGAELAWRPGMEQWQPLDVVLQEPPPSDDGILPPPMPAEVRRRESNRILLIVAVAVAFLMVGGLIFIIPHFRSLMQQARTDFEAGFQSAVDNGSVAMASQPITWTSNTWTMKDVQARQREFRLRQYLEGYRQRGQHGMEWQPKAELMLAAWIDTNFGGPLATNDPPYWQLAKELVAEPTCQDPLIFTVAAVSSYLQTVKKELLEKALSRFPNSGHASYPSFYATVSLCEEVLQDRTGRWRELDYQALELLAQALAEGSVAPEDQAEIAETLVNGWGYQFFKRNRQQVCEVVQRAGESFTWLAETLRGEFHIMEAWKARGGGYAHTVTDEGWQGFRDHLAQARGALTQAWELRPDLALPAARMIYVSLGDSGLAEMRTWFDRTLLLQIDHAEAWKQMQWGLRPRWYGSIEAMQALGETALNTERFDTQVPYKLNNIVFEMQHEMKLEPGAYLFGDPNIWPLTKRMYDGYIAHHAGGAAERGWRSMLAAVAYLGEKYEVAREQMEWLDWKPNLYNLRGWNRELSLLPLEVAARTGLAAEKIALAEMHLNQRAYPRALESYEALSTASDLDERSAAFVRHRLAALRLRAQVQNHEWMDWMPEGGDDPAWVFHDGAVVKRDGTGLELKSAQYGHLIFSRATVGSDFEVRGEFEVVAAPASGFEAGLAMGLPDYEASQWYAFRMRREGDGREVAILAQAWNGREDRRSVNLREGPNSFEFRFVGGLIHAFVNGQEVFKLADPPAKISFPGHDYFVGLGGYDSDGSQVIRYSKVQLRAVAYDSESE